MLRRIIAKYLGSGAYARSAPVSRICPGCGTFIPYIGGLEVRFAGVPGASWYRYAPRRLYCKFCARELRVVLAPVGYVFSALIIIFSLGVCALWLFDPWTSLIRAGAAVGLVGAMILMVRCIQMWGIRFSLYASDFKTGSGN